MRFGPSIGAAFAATVLFGVSLAHAETINFDDLTGTEAPILNGYAGLDWNNFVLLNTPNFTSVIGPNGFANGTVSGPNIAFNGTGDAAAISGPTFTFNSAYFTGAWYNGLGITATGYLGGNLVGTSIFIVNASGPTLETFDWTVDKVSFSSSGGTNAGYGSNGTQFAMDNMTINEPLTTTPLPSTAYAGLGLLGGLGCWTLARRRKVVAK